LSNGSEVKKDIVSRWGGDPVILEEGFVGVPTTFLKYHSQLEPSLTPAEVLFILQLMVFKWDKRSPFPKYKVLSKRMGVTEVYARKLARVLQDKGYLIREMRIGTTNRFNLEPLFERLVHLLRSRRPDTEP
jgi:hypothetical protein